MLQILRSCFSRGQGGSVFCGLLLTLLAMLPVPAPAQCSTVWNAAGIWQITQQGQRYPIKLSLDQKDRMITGTAEHTIVIPKDRGLFGKFGEIRPVSGKVSGAISGDDFTINIYWGNRTAGIYKSKISASGMLDGKAHEMSSPNVLHSWQGQTALTCPKPLPKPISRTGRSPRTEPKPSATDSVKASPAGGAMLKPPFITAGQPVIPAPGHPFGIVPVGWDGGPDNPNVAVWLSMNNGIESPAFSIEHVQQSPVWKQPKASLALQLRRGHHYKLVLKDSAGRTLSSSAGFVVP